MITPLLLWGGAQEMVMAFDCCQKQSRATALSLDTVKTLKEIGADLLWHGKYNYLHGKPNKEANSGNIYRVTWNDCSVTAAMLAPLKDLRALEELTFSNCNIDKAAWKVIKELEIKDLSFFHCKLTKQDIRGIAQLKGLRILDLYDTGITDEEVSILGSLTELRELDLSENNLTDKSLETIKIFTNLRELNLDASAVSDAGIRKIQHLKKITYLNLNTTKITDQALVEIQGMTELEELQICDTAITDACIPQIMKFKKLRWLDVSYTKMTDAGFERLKSLRLQHLRTQRPFTKEMAENLMREYEEYIKKQKKENKKTQQKEQ